jgi:DNA polymerase phi
MLDARMADEADLESDGSEMEVNDDSKSENGDVVSMDENDSGNDGGKDVGEQEPNPAIISSPFLDAFYELSSPNARDRARAAQVILQHSVVDSATANAKDAAYTLKRLLNGVCSGRASARQGNASALSSFLQLTITVASQHSSSMVVSMEDIITESLSGVSSESRPTALSFVRQRFETVTNPGGNYGSGGKRKGSEERDYYFGRLFGILAISRSGILVPIDPRNHSNVEECRLVANAFLKDLADLYHLKKWMREPVAHAVGTLLNTVFEVDGDAGAKESCRGIADGLVSSVVIPRLLAFGDNDMAKKSTIPNLATYSAEQVAIALNIQAHYESISDLPIPLNQPVMSLATVTHLADSLSATSGVTQPRTHLVWDSMWIYFSQSLSTNDDASLKRSSIDIRVLRDTLPEGSEQVSDVFRSIFRHVVVERLLALPSELSENSEGAAMNQGRKATHERRSLALCLVRNMLGVPFMSSVIGRMRLVVSPSFVEIVLQEPVVGRVILDVLGTGKGSASKGSRQQADHLLKPLVSETLQSIVSSTKEESSFEKSHLFRLAIAKSLLKCDSRFDGASKTSTVAELMGLGEQGAPITAQHLQTLLDFTDFLEAQFLRCLCLHENSELVPSMGSTAYKALGYLDQIFSVAKAISRATPADGPGEVDQLLNRIIAFFFATGFFDTRGLTPPDQIVSPSKKRKNAKKSFKSDVVMENMAVQSGRLAQSTIMAGNSEPIPFHVRSTIASRFFSVIAESISPGGAITDHAARYLSTMKFCRTGWEELASKGGTSYAILDGDDFDLKEITSVVEQLESDATSNGEGPRARLFTACSLLASTLHLYLLCYEPDQYEQSDDDGEIDGMNDIASDIKAVENVKTLFSVSDLQEDPMPFLAEVCLGMLSSYLGSNAQSWGASSRVLREAIKAMWTAGLEICAKSDTVEPVLDNSVLSLILEAVGATDEDCANPQHFDDDDGVDSGQDSPSEEELDVESEHHLEDENDEMAERDEQEGDSDEEMEIGNDALQSLLEEDADADVLEHHEGADSALAKLIKVRQQARKAGQLARERIEISRRIRRLVLVETLILGKSEGWGPLLRREHVFRVLSALLTSRKTLEKSIASNVDGNTNSAMSEKRSMVEKLSSLLKTKALRIKISSFEWGEGCDVTQVSISFATNLMAQLREPVSKEQRALCSAALQMVLRAVDSENRDSIMLLYDEALSEWATKRTSRLETFLFDDLIHYNPVVAQLSFADPVIGAINSARSPFVRCEVLRLTSVLFNPKINPLQNDLDVDAMRNMVGARERGLQQIFRCLEDDEMRNPKRLRSALKAAEKVLSFGHDSCQSDVSVMSEEIANEARSILLQIRGQSGNASIQQECEKITRLLGSQPKGITPTVEDSIMSVDKGDNSDLSENDEETKQTDGARSKKKKKKKSDKKRKK